MEVIWCFLINVQYIYDCEKKLVEKYDVSSIGIGGGGGEYFFQDGFGWINGVMLKMFDLICLQEKLCDSVLFICLVLLSVMLIKMLFVVMQ